MEWRKKLVTADIALSRIRPGMSVFLSTAAAEPRTLVKHLMATHNANLQDLELIQILSFAEAISPENLQSQKFRLKTFFFRMGGR
jgi:acyl-CoA hydrolase